MTRAMLFERDLEGPLGIIRLTSWEEYACGRRVGERQNTGEAPGVPVEYKPENRLELDLGL